MRPVIAAFVILAAAQADVTGECDMAALYLELGCSSATANATATGSTAAATTATAAATGPCPDAFVCPDLHPDPAVCTYRGVAYRAGAPLPDAAVRNPCSRACACAAQPPPRFDCAAVDCVETFEDLRRECVTTYRLGECCSSGTVCGADAIARLSTCEVDGRTYRQGERYTPRGTRSSCVCAAGGGAACEAADCGVEVHYQPELRRRCAPVFANTALSCPIDFMCPSPNTTIVKGVNSKGVTATCNFGNRTLAVGDSVATDDRCTRCRCLVPPLVTCVLSSPCEA